MKSGFVVHIVETTKIKEQKLMMKRLLFNEQLLPFVSLGIFFNGPVTQLKQVLYIPGKIKAVEPSAHYTIRRFKIKNIYHNGSVLTGFEMMLMFHHFKITFHLFINKMTRFFHFGDFYPKQSCFKKMPGLPGNSIFFFY